MNAFPNVVSTNIEELVLTSNSKAIWVVADLNNSCMETDPEGKSLTGVEFCSSRNPLQLSPARMNTY